jgi:tetratricopeptide (TPR) repeat protein
LAFLTGDPADGAVSEEMLIARIREQFGFLGASVTVVIRDGVAHIALPAAAAAKADEATKLYERAGKRARDGDFARAAELYSRVLKLNPALPAAHRDLAMSLVELQRPEEAKDALIDALRLKPDDAWSLVVLGNVYVQQPDGLARARQFFERALELRPADAWALNGCQRRDGRRIFQRKYGSTRQPHINSLQLSDRSVPHPRRQHMVFDHRPILETHLKHRVSLLHPVDQRAAFHNRKSRLFAHDVLARRQRQHRHRHVPVVRSGNDDCIDVRGRKQRAKVRVFTATLGSVTGIHGIAGAPRSTGKSIAHRDNLRVILLQEALKIIAVAMRADPDEPERDSIRGRGYASQCESTTWKRHRAQGGRRQGQESASR